METNTKYQLITGLTLIENVNGIEKPVTFTPTAADIQVGDHTCKLYTIKIDGESKEEIIDKMVRFIDLMFDKNLATT